MRTFLAFLFLTTFCLANCGGLRLPDLLSRVQTQSLRNLKRQENDSTTPYPSHEQMMDNLYEIQKTFMFPGSNYLIDMLHKYVQYLIETGMTPDQMKEHFELPECEVKELMMNLHDASYVIYDSEVLAIYATRMLMKPILQERMKCPASVIDVVFAKMMIAMEWNFRDSEDNYLYDRFIDILSKLDPELQPYIDDIAAQGVHEFHGHLFNKSTEVLFTFGLKDVAMSSHRLYENLVWFFSSEDTSSMYSQYTEDQLMETVQSSLLDVWCPSSYEMIDHHRRIAMMLKNQFAMIEREDICSGLADFLYNYIQHNLPWHQPTFENTTDFWMLCSTFEDVMNQVADLLTKYDNSLTSRSIEDVQVILREYLTDEDWEMFSEALRMLGFFDTIHI